MFKIYIKSKYIHEYLKDNKLILINTLTFSYATFKNKDVEFWENNKIDFLDKNKVKFLVDNKFLIKNPVDDKNFLNKAYSIFGTRDHLTPSFLVYITNECNLKCPYCFQMEERKRKVVTLDNKYIDNLIQTIKLLSKDKGYINRVTIFGGEPFLPKNKNLIKILMERLKEANCKNIDIITNGIFLNEFNDILSEYKDLICNIKFTLNGPSYIHDKIRSKLDNQKTFNTIVNNIRFLIKKYENFKVQINLLLDQNNINSISQLLDELYYYKILPNKNVSLEFGRVQFRSNPINNDYKEELPYTDYFPKLLNIKKQDARINDNMLIGSEVSILGEMYRAWIGGQVVVPNFKCCRAVYPGRYCFYPDGNIYPCTEISGNEKYAVGKYYPEFKILENSKKWKDYSLKKIEKCKECKYIGICNGGCPVSNLGVNGNIENIFCLDIEKSLNNFINELDCEDFFYDRC